MIRKYYFNADKRRIGSTLEGEPGSAPVLTGEMPDAVYVITIDYLPETALLLDTDNQSVLHIRLDASGTDEEGNPVFTESIDSSIAPVSYTEAQYG